MRELVGCLLLLAAGAPAWAQERGGFGRGGGMRSAAFQALDTDRDGVISASELAKASDSLQALDKNRDGKLTADEVRPQMGGRSRGQGERGETAPRSADEVVTAVMAFDKNGDGRLTRDELPERMQGLFERADADKDGVLTADELRKSAQATSGERAAPNAARLDPILAAIDANSDGEISADELAAASKSLKKLDSDGDGQLTQDEVRPNFGPRDGRGRA